MVMRPGLCVATALRKPVDKLNKFGMHVELTSV